MTDRDDSGTADKQRLFGKSESSHGQVTNLPYFVRRFLKLQTIGMITDMRDCFVHIYTQCQTQHHNVRLCHHAQLTPAAQIHKTAGIRQHSPCCIATNASLFANEPTRQSPARVIMTAACAAPVTDTTPQFSTTSEKAVDSTHAPRHFVVK
jgi:hypothetical protein